MSVAVLDGVTVTKLVEGWDVFSKCVDEHLSVLDVSGHGVFSPSELHNAFGFMFLENESNYTKEDTSSFHKNGIIGVQEIRTEMKEVMFAVAQGIGHSPAHVALECNSLLMRAF